MKLIVCIKRCRQGDHFKHVRARLREYKIDSFKYYSDNSLTEIFSRVTINTACIFHRFNYISVKMFYYKAISYPKVFQHLSYYLLIQQRK